MECFDDEETCKAKTKQMITEITSENAAKGRSSRAFDITDKHAITGNKMLPPFPNKYVLYIRNLIRDLNYVSIITSFIFY